MRGCHERLLTIGYERLLTINYYETFIAAPSHPFQSFFL